MSAVGNSACRRSSSECSDASKPVPAQTTRTWLSKTLARKNDKSSAYSTSRYNTVRFATAEARETQLAGARTEFRDVTMHWNTSFNNFCSISVTQSKERVAATASR